MSGPAEDEIAGRREAVRGVRLAMQTAAPINGHLPPAGLMELGLVVPEVGGRIEEHEDPDGLSDVTSDGGVPETEEERFALARQLQLRNNVGARVLFLARAGSPPVHGEWEVAEVGSPSVAGGVAGTPPRQRGSGAAVRREPPVGLVRASSAGGVRAARRSAGSGSGEGTGPYTRAAAARGPRAVGGGRVTPAAPQPSGRTWLLRVRSFLQAPVATRYFDFPEGMDVMVLRNSLAVATDTPADEIVVTNGREVLLDGPRLSSVLHPGEFVATRRVRGAQPSSGQRLVVIPDGESNMETPAAERAAGGGP